MPRPPKPAQPDDATAQVSARLPRRLVNALKLASVAREVGNRKPWTQTEIIEAALTDWLTREGHLAK